MNAVLCLKFLSEIRKRPARLGHSLSNTLDALSVVSQASHFFVSFRVLDDKRCFAINRQDFRAFAFMQPFNVFRRLAAELRDRVNI